MCVRALRLCPRYRLRPLNRYIISIHQGLEGVRLSLVGNYGNIPFNTVDEAETFIKQECGSSPFTIEREVHRRRKRIGGLNHE